MTAKSIKEAFGKNCSLFLFCTIRGIFVLFAVDTSVCVVLDSLMHENEFLILIDLIVNYSPSVGSAAFVLSVLLYPNLPFTCYVTQMCP